MRPERAGEGGGVLIFYYAGNKNSVSAFGQHGDGLRSAAQKNESDKRRVLESAGHLWVSHKQNGLPRECMDGA